MDRRQLPHPQRLLRARKRDRWRRRGHGKLLRIQKLILFDEVQVPHFNYVGDSILGHHAHLGAGVILSNVKLDHAEIAVVTPDGHIPTGLKNSAQSLAIEPRSAATQ